MGTTTTTTTTTPTTAIEAAAARRDDGGGVGPNIRERRQALGVSQLGLAIRSHCGENTVFRIEAGGGYTQFTLRKITDALTVLEAEAKAA